MGFVDIELTPEVHQALRRYWGVRSDGAAERLFGGEESAAFRIGEYAVRIGPVWRSDEELQWSYSIAAQIAPQVPEVTRPVPCTDGRYLVRVGGHPVSLWPYVAGGSTDPDDVAYETNQLRAFHALGASS